MLNKNFKIDKSIYDEKSINSAIDNFKEIWNIKYKDGTLNIEWNTEAEIEEIFNELMNYVIWLINE